MAAVPAKQPLRITELPPDVLYTIFPHLSLRNFVNFTNCTRAFFPYRQDPAYWSHLTRSTFRIPPQPLLEGKRWQWLYKKLRTQTRLYTWGDNKSGNLGHVKPLRQGYEHLRPYPHTESSGYPREPWVGIHLGIVADVQCGGWCTTMLNSDGCIFIMGVLDGLGYRSRNAHGYHIRILTFPPYWDATTNTSYSPSTAIKQYSTGRSNVLGLSDDGKIWEWTSDDCAVLVIPQGIDLGQHEVLEVQAGWDRSAALVKDVGIIYWTSSHASNILPGGQQTALQTASGATLNTATVPGTAYRPRSPRNFSEVSLDAQIGEVRQFVFLEGFVVFTTHKNRIFSSIPFLPGSRDQDAACEPIELTTFYSHGINPNDSQTTFEIRTLVGSYANFAIITSTGTVLTASTSYLLSCHSLALTKINEPSFTDPPPNPTLLPSLQTGDIVSLSFGDHHLHALHNDGTLTSLGTECHSCGALGLGSRIESHYRGVQHNGGSWGDGQISKDTKAKRTVWFEPLMERWIGDLIRNSMDPTGDIWDERLIRAVHTPQWREKAAEWFEKEGRKWMVLESPKDYYATDTSKRGERAQKANDSLRADDDLPPYFALKVASAGWHSAALVLVDEEKTQAVRERYIIPTPPAPEKSFWGGLRDLGTRFLGLEERDEREEAKVGGKGYVWEGQQLPVLDD